MERKKYILIVLLFLANFSLLGQNNATIYKAYTSNEMLLWKKHIDSLQALPDLNLQKRHELLNYQYGYIGWCIGEERNTEASFYFNQAKANMAYLEQEGYELAELHAYKSAFIGFEIGLAPMKAPFIGMQSIDYANKSIAMDSSNYLGYLQLGNIEFYMPAVFGGSKHKAIAYYQKAMLAMEESGVSLKQNWNYLSLYALLSAAYYEVKNYHKAHHYSQKALKIAPNFTWITKELQPKILNALTHE